MNTALLLDAYRQGLFPMAVDEEGQIGWFSPDPRALIPLDDRFHIPHGLKRVLKRNPFAITVDQAFEEVIRGCATRHGSTWISRVILEDYIRLHHEGYAHSIEAWHEDRLAGGLYGVHLGGAFFGESMFHNVTNASKAALVALVQRLRQRGFLILDTQWTTPHLEQFGVVTVPRQDYLTMLAQALLLPCVFTP